MAILDKKKPYGEVFGPAPYRYEQNSKFFDAQGNEVDAEGNPIARPGRPKKVAE